MHGQGTKLSGPSKCPKMSINSQKTRQAETRNELGFPILTKDQKESLILKLWWQRAVSDSCNVWSGWSLVFARIRSSDILKQQIPEKLACGRPLQSRFNIWKSDGKSVRLSESSSTSTLSTFLPWCRLVGNSFSFGANLLGKSAFAVRKLIWFPSKSWAGYCCSLRLRIMILWYYNALLILWCFIQRTFKGRERAVCSLVNCAKAAAAPHGMCSTHFLPLLCAITLTLTLTLQPVLLVVPLFNHHCTAK